MIYYERSTDQYKEYEDGEWSTVPGKRMDKILKDKAYINDPNIDFLKFLEVRSIFFGIKFDF